MAEDFDVVIEEDEFPLRSSIGVVDGIVVFDGETVNAVDAAFLRSLRDLPSPDGPAEVSSYPFFAFRSADDAQWPLRTAQDVIDALRPKHFNGGDRVDLTATGGFSCAVTGHDQFDFIDEIHNDFEQQQFWPTITSLRYDWVNAHYYDNVADPVLRDQYMNGIRQPTVVHKPPAVPDDLIREDPTDNGAHGQLKAYVRDGRIWYVKIHTTKTMDDICTIVLLFCVGVSPDNNLVGILAGQSPE